MNDRTNEFPAPIPHDEGTPSAAADAQDETGAPDPINAFADTSPPAGEHFTESSTAATAPDDIEADDIEKGPPVSELGDGPTGDGDGDNAGADDSEKKASKPRRKPSVGIRVRLERADGSRFWHVESVEDPDVAVRLAAERGGGTPVRNRSGGASWDAVDADGEPIEHRDNE